MNSSLHLGLSFMNSASCTASLCATSVPATLASTSAGS